MKKLEIVALIPARGGSKGIPGKNLVKLGGKPLISFSISAALSAQLITKTIVISDDQKIIKTASKLKAETITLPEKLANDDSPMNMVVSYAIKALLNTFSKLPDFIVLLQPTSPLRTAIDIDNAIQLLITEKANSLISVTLGQKEILKSFLTNKDGYLKGISNDKYPFTPRTLLPDTYRSNGAIYILRAKSFIKNPAFLTSKTIPFVMPIERSVDIDNLADLEEASNYLQKNEY